LGFAPAPPLKMAASSFAERAPVENEPLKVYRAAYQDLTGGRHDDAARGFRDFLRRYPRHDYADNAQYWLGECYYDRRRFQEAAVEFRAVVARYPTGNKAPDAMLKLGFSLLAAGEVRKGRELLAQVPTTYPRTDAARLAEHRLTELKEVQ
jgi:tol-pal system protein YbgF